VPAVSFTPVEKHSDTEGSWGVLKYRVDTLRTGDADLRF